ncbi:MAG: glycosyltransferase [Bacteroidales bacterium]|nr:glycosyltransferase [Bacteroidales bacterium]
MTFAHVEAVKSLKTVTAESKIVMKKKVILSVTNDLFTDPRVDKTCRSLLSLDFEVLLLGRRYNNSPFLEPREYQTKRFFLIFRKGPFFYAEYNLRLFFFLLFQNFDVLVANDLDTLLPNFLISKWRKKHLVYDSHEYFCGILEIKDRPIVRKIWLSIEKLCFPKLKNVITVSQSIANQYENEYGVKVHVVRNIPLSTKPPIIQSRSRLALPENKIIVILQGNAIHRDRGGEEMIEAMQFLDNVCLLIVGSGDVIPLLKERTNELQLSEKVKFVGRVPADVLFNFTCLADIGIAFDKDVSMNHHFSLPNKIFDYIKAEIPYLCTNLPERKYITEKYKVGVVLENINPETIAHTIQTLISDASYYQQLKENCRKAALELTWENEEKVLKAVYLNLN